MTATTSAVAAAAAATTSLQQGCSPAQPSTGPEVCPSGVAENTHNRTTQSHPASSRYWPRSRKLYVVFTGMLLTLNSGMGASLPSGGFDALAIHFRVLEPRQIPLPVAVFLIGFIFAPVIFGPMSESRAGGRRLSLLLSFAIYTVFTVACANAPNWACLMAFRFLSGIGASAPPIVSQGMFADIYPDPLQRGRVVAPLALVSTLGSLISPVISGFTGFKDWRWMFWISLIIAGATWPFLLMLPETYEPILAERRERSTTLQTGKFFRKVRVCTKPFNVKNLVRITLSRPFRMLLDPIVLLADLFLLLMYSAFFLYLEAYPSIFIDTYEMNVAKSSLMLLPIGIGVILAMLFCFWYDQFLIKAQNKGKLWATREEYHRLPLVCIGGPLSAVSQFWLAFSSRPDVHWVVPMLSGIPFGLGLDLVAMGLNNYITDAYEVYSASAMASSLWTRNVAAVLLLPLAAFPMYGLLGQPWACVILGSITLSLSIIPFGFIRYGPKLRARSKFCQKLRDRRLLDGTVGTDL